VEEGTERKKGSSIWLQEPDETSNEPVRLIYVLQGLVGDDDIKSTVGFPTPDVSLDKHRRTRSLLLFGSDSRRLDIPSHEINAGHIQRPRLDECECEITESTADIKVSQVRLDSKIPSEARDQPCQAFLSCFRIEGQAARLPVQILFRGTVPTVDQGPQQPVVDLLTQHF